MNSDADPAFQPMLDLGAVQTNLQLAGDELLQQPGEKEVACAYIVKVRA